MLWLPIKSQLVEYLLLLMLYEVKTNFFHMNKIRVTYKLKRYLLCGNPLELLNLPKIGTINDKIITVGEYEPIN